MNKHLFFLLMGSILILDGCTMAPEYTRPTAPVPAGFPSGNAYPESRGTTSIPDPPDLQWREFFSDEKLKKIIETALENNRNLRLAALNVERARAIYGIKRAELFPAVNAGAGGNLQRVPADLSSDGNAKTTERYDVNLAIASWEIDFFGRIRILKDRALEEYLATEQARRSAQILLISEVANAYLTLAADREKLMLTEKTFETQKTAYDLIKRRYELGLATELDLARVQTQMDTARGDIARFTQLTAQDENALNLLIGYPSLTTKRVLSKGIG